MISTTIVTGQGGDNQCMANRCTSRQSLIGTELNKVNVGPNVVSTSAYLGNGKDTDNRKNVQTGTEFDGIDETKIFPLISDFFCYRITQSS